MSKGPWKKVTPNILYKRYFMVDYPKAAKHVVYWCPSGYMALEVWLDDGNVYVYCADPKQFTYIRTREVFKDGKLKKNDHKSNQKKS